MLEAWSASQLLIVLLSIGHADVRRCSRGAGLAVATGIVPMLAAGGPGGLSEAVASSCRPEPVYTRSPSSPAKNKTFIGGFMFKRCRLLLLSLLAPLATSAAHAEQFSVLLFSKT